MYKMLYPRQWKQIHNTPDLNKKRFDIMLNKANLQPKKISADENFHVSPGQT